MWPHSHMTADQGFPHLSQCVDSKKTRESWWSNPNTRINLLTEDHIKTNDKLKGQIKQSRLIIVCKKKRNYVVASNYPRALFGTEPQRKDELRTGAGHYRAGTQLNLLCLSSFLFLRGFKPHVDPLNMHRKSANFAPNAEKWLYCKNDQIWAIAPPI